MSSRLPALGPRGEGWVVAQDLLMLVIAGLGIRDLALNGWVNPYGPGAVAIGLAVIMGGVLVIGLAALVLRTALTPFPRPVAGAPHVQSGVYRRIRHPIYGGLLLTAIGWGVGTGSLSALIATAVLFLVLDGKARREEAWLVQAHPGYADYRRRTKRFVPGLY